MIQRGGPIVIGMLADVKQRTIGPLIEGTIAPESDLYTDAYAIEAQLPPWGYTHHTVGPATGACVRDEDGVVYCELAVNTLEGFWSLLRSWLRPHRGISQPWRPL